MGPSSVVTASGLVGVVLAAGEGRRLRPITDRLPKALCPVGGIPLVDLAIERVAPLVDAVAVNVHHHRDLLVAHLRRRGDVEISIEVEEALGTAGGVARLRPWIEGRAAVVVNADGWTPDPLVGVLDGWDGASIRVLVHRDDRLRDDSSVVASVLPASVVASLDERPSGLFESVWRAARADGRLEVVRFDGPFIDCGTPVDYLRANLTAAALGGGSIVAVDAMLEPGSRVERSVVGAGACVAGTVVDSVVWPGQSVAADESLSRAVRVDPTTTVVVEDVPR